MDRTYQRQYLEGYAQEIQDLVYDGQKIQAITLAREITGCGLKEAKELIGYIEDELRSRFPGSFPDRKKSSGCATSLFLILSITVTIVLLLLRML